MKHRLHFVALVAALGLWMGGDLLACGDKFLVGGRGTRYQRLKTARAASVLIYANPSSGLPAALTSGKVKSALKGVGHKSTTVETHDQLSAILTGGRFDVILAASSAAAGIEQLLGQGPDRAIVLAFDAAPKEQLLLKAIDKAVEQHDQNAKRARTSS